MATIAKIQQAVSDAETTPGTMFYTNKRAGIGVAYDARNYEFRIYNSGQLDRLENWSDGAYNALVGLEERAQQRR